MNRERIQKRIQKIVPWVLVLLWMVLIFLFSHQPATESAQLSSGITEKILNIINKVLPKISINQESFNHFIRKAAHFGVYFVLGFLVINALVISNRPRNTWSKLDIFLIGMLISVLYAISDEVHQLFIPGRSGELRDVLLDSLGSLTGIVCMFILRWDRGPGPRKD